MVVPLTLELLEVLLLTTLPLPLPPVAVLPGLSVVVVDDKACDDDEVAVWSADFDIIPVPVPTPAGFVAVIVDSVVVLEGGVVPPVEAGTSNCPLRA